MNNETIIQNELIANIRISDGAYRLYIMLQSMCYGQKCECYPSEHYLATSLGRSVRTVQRYLKELVQHNLIVKRRRGSTSNKYTVLAKISQKAREKINKAVNKAKQSYNSFKNGSNAPKPKESAWSNYAGQRDYNFSNLEGILLGNTEYNPDILYQK